MAKNDSNSSYLPEHLENPFIARLPPLMDEKQAIAALSEEPTFRAEERNLPDQLRRACIMRLNHHYFKPLRRHLVLNERVGQVLREGYDGRNISTGQYFQHLRDNHERVVQRNPTMSTTTAHSSATALSLVGCSGMGKTETIRRILNAYPKVIEHEVPYAFQQVVWMKLECPHMGSAKQLCLDFFSSMDELLGPSSTYYRQFRREGLDLLNSQMGRVANQHGLGLLVIDEFQELLNGPGKDRQKLLNFLLNLVNKIGVPLLFVGTLAATPLLNDTVRNARRASGLGSMVWERLGRQDGWDFIVSDLWRFQWTREPTELTPEVVDCLYEETQGILDLVVKLFILAQFYAIELSSQFPEKRGRERLSVNLLRQVAKENFKLLEPMLSALKRGDRLAIALYDDIRPFHDHIQEIFYRAAPSAGGQVLVASGPSAVVTTETQDPLQQVRLALSGLGIAPDLVEIVLEKAVSNAGANDPLAIIGAATAELRNLPPVPATPKSKSRPRTAARNVKPDLDVDDLRSVVAKGSDDGKSAYDALVEAGIIAPVDQVYRVS